MASDAITVKRGDIVALRLFDVAYAIDLGQAESLWSTHAGGGAKRSQLAHTPPKAMAFGVPPLELALEQDTIELGGISIPLHAKARIYDFGVVALALHVPVADLSWADFGARFIAVDRTLGTEADAAPWHTRLRQLVEVISPALTRPNEQRLEEDFLIGVVNAMEPALTADALRERVDLAALLSGDARPLSDAAREELLQRSFSYYTDDLVVLNWDRAFVCEPRGDTDVLDVIEVANVQLLEFRYYQALLDEELRHMYPQVQAAQGASGLLAARRFAHLARRLYTLVAEVTELTTRVDNALQVTEDIYLARVYSAALELFRVRNLSATVERKLAIIRDTYASLYDEASSRRAELLEIAIVLLILIEILMALWSH